MSELPVVVTRYIRYSVSARRPDILNSFSALVASRESWTKSSLATSLKSTLVTLVVMGESNL